LYTFQRGRVERAGGTRSHTFLSSRFATLRVYVGFHLLTESLSSFLSKKKTAVAKNVQNQENLGQKAKAKPPDPAMDSHEDREHHSLQRQEKTLEKNQVEHLIHYYYI